MIWKEVVGAGVGILLLACWGVQHELGGLDGIRRRAARRRLKWRLASIADEAGASVSEWTASDGSVWLGYSFEDGCCASIPVAKDGGYNPNFLVGRFTKDWPKVEIREKLAQAIVEACRVPH